IAIRSQYTRWPVFTISRAKRRNSALSDSGRKSFACVAVFRNRMKFPLRLSLDLLRSRVSRALVGGAGAASTIFHLSPSTFSSTNQKEIEAESDPAAAVMEIPAAVLSQTIAPVLGVGGEEPLQHPVIGRIAAALNQAGR